VFSFPNQTAQLRNETQTTNLLGAKDSQSLSPPNMHFASEHGEIKAIEVDLNDLTGFRLKDESVKVIADLFGSEQSGVKDGQVFIVNRPFGKKVSLQYTNNHPIAFAQLVDALVDPNTPPRFQVTSAGTIVAARLPVIPLPSQTKAPPQKTQADPPVAAIESVTKNIEFWEEFEKQNSSKWVNDEPENLLQVSEQLIEILKKEVPPNPKKVANFIGILKTRGIDNNRLRVLQILIESDPKALVRIAADPREKITDEQVRALRVHLKNNPRIKEFFENDPRIQKTLLDQLLHEGSSETDSDPLRCALPRI
jgi:hypothetical protein